MRRRLAILRPIYQPTAQPSLRGSLPPLNTPVAGSRRIIWPPPNMLRSKPPTGCSRCPRRRQFCQCGEIPALFHLDETTRLSWPLPCMGAAQRPARHVQRLLGGHTQVDHVDQHLEVPLWLHIAAHDAEAGVQSAGMFAVVVDSHGRDDGLVGAFVGRQSVGVLRIQLEERGPVLQADAGSRNDQPAAGAL